MDEAQRQQRLAALNTANSNMAMAQNISRGIPPTNAQIATALEGTERALRSNAIPPGAQKVTNDTATLLHDMKEALVDRNKDENIQGLIKDIGMMSTTAGPKVKAAKPALIAGKAAQGSMEDATESLKQLIRAVVRQHDFRVGLREVVSTLQWAFYQRTHQVRSNVDQQWSGDQYYCSSNPHLATTLGATSATATTSTIPTTVPSGIPTYQAHPVPSGIPTYQAHPSAAATLPKSTVLPATTGAPLTPGYNTVLPGTTSAAAATTGAMASAVTSAPSHDFEPPKAAVTEAQKRLANLRPMTEAERIELRTRLLTSMLKLNATPELRQAMTNFYNVLSWTKAQTMKAQSSISSAISSASAVPTTTASRGVATTTTGITPVPGAVASAPTFKSVMKRFKRLLEEFTGTKSLTDLSTYTRDFVYLVKDDPKLRALFQDAGSFGTDFVSGNYTSMNQIPPQQIARLDSLIQRTDDSFMGMANHYLLWRLLEEIQNVTNAIRDDPLRQKLAQDTRILMQDLIYYDGMGNPQLNTEVVSQLRHAIIPILREELSYIPLPRIEGSDDKIDYWVDGVVLTTTDILPDNVKIDARSKTMFNRPGLSGGAINTIRVTLDNVRIHLKNVKFWYRKKTFPKMTDQGFVDFFLTRNGLRVNLKLESNLAAENVFTVRDVRVNADRLKVKIHQSHHDFLYAIVLGLFTGRIRRTIELKTEEAIRNSFTKINAATNQMVRSISTARGQATSGLGSKIAQPLASAMNTYVHPSTSH